MIRRLASLLFLLVPTFPELALGASSLQSFTDLSAPGPTESDLEAEFHRVREHLRSLPEYQDDGAETHYRLGQALHHRGDVKGAADEYRLALERNSTLIEAYRDLGTLLLDRHDYAGAVAALEQAIRLGRRDGNTYYWLGRGLMGTGAWPAAVTALQAATQLNPDDAEAFADLGLVRMAQGDVDAATAALRTSIQLKPDYSDAHALLETVTALRAAPSQVKRAAETILAKMFSR